MIDNIYKLIGSSSDSFHKLPRNTNDNKSFIFFPRVLSLAVLQLKQNMPFNSMSCSVQSWIYGQGPLLITWINFNTHMDK